MEKKNHNVSICHCFVNCSNDIIDFVIIFSKKFSSFFVQRKKNEVSEEYFIHIIGPGSESEIQLLKTGSEYRKFIERIRCDFEPRLQGRKLINPSGGYPPDVHRMKSDLWPMSVERRFQSMR